MRAASYILLALPILIRSIAAQPPEYSYQILYTGRTLGYARVPDQQTLPASAGGPSAIGQEFLDQFALASTSSAAQFRIAMGDNFSPDLYGRSIQVDSSIAVPSCDGTPNGLYSPTIHLPKDYFDYENGGWYIWCHPAPKDELIHAPFSDNVADFLIRAHYDTVVPGKHDFYFGPQYLRQIAGYLAAHGVHMLAENMIVVSSVAPEPLNAHPRIPERLAQPCHWNTGTDHECYHTDFGPASLDLPDNVLPWKRQFVLHGARSASIKGTNILFRKDELKNFKDVAVDYHQVFDPRSAEVCAEPGPATAGDPAKVLKAGRSCYDLIASDAICTVNAPDHLKSTCKALYPDADDRKAGIYDPTAQTASTDITFLFRDPGAHLRAGLNHMFCAKPTPEFPIFGDGSIPICQPFPVQVPMFWVDPEVRQPPAGMAACGEASIECPYALIARGNLKVAIFAVVDPDLLSNVGMLNTSWRNTRSRTWDTVTQITAPDYALLQTLDLCYASDECRNAPKVLMAQMSYARATQLISNSSFNGVFDVVVTQASPEHDTGSIETRYQGKMPRFALTPPEPLSTDSVTGALTRDGRLAQGQSLSMSVFTPQVYVATVTKKKAAQAPNRDGARGNPRAALPAVPSQTCQDSLPNSDTPPPDIMLLPSPGRPHDFGPCWSMRNSSVRWDTSLLGPEAPAMDLQKFAARTAKPVCKAADKQCVDLERLAQKYLASLRMEKTAQAHPLTQPTASDPLSQAVLVAMRNVLRTDAAIIQTRDLYDGDNLSRESIESSEIQDQISRVIWKGDEAIVLHVTGATIRKLLKQSATFAQLDKNSLNTEIETGRDLVTLGIYPDPKDSDTYYINGAVMSDTALYTVAASDFISGGDTGYANLVPPDVLPAFRVSDFARKQVHPLAGLVCKAIAPNPPGRAELCADMQLGADYFDISQRSPSDATPGYSTVQHWHAIARNFRMPRRPLAYSEEAAQQRPFWSFKLENLDFSESGVFINHFAKTTTSLAGISNPLIANSGTQNIGADHKARLVFDYRKGTAYLLSDSSFLYNRTTSGPPTLAYNVLGSEAGGTLRLPVPRTRTGLSPDTPKRDERPSWLSFQYSIRYERELVTPSDTQVTLMPLPAGVPSVSTVTLPTPKISTIYGRTGLRGESGDAFLEIGLEQIDARGLAQTYTLPQPNGLPYYCHPSASLALGCGMDPTPNSALNTTPLASLMLAGPPTVTAALQTTSYRTPGAYLNFYWKFPILSRRDANRADQSFYFTLTNKGDIYFNTGNDTAVQTRYLDKLTPALSFPVWAGISLTPKVDFILYENKINRFHYQAVQPSVSLSYTFSWREGMSWSRAFRYGAQTTTASPAGSTH
jgi:hypothetical protein